MQYETFTDIPTIFNIKISENVGYIKPVILYINDNETVEADWTGRFVMKNGTRYSIFSASYTFKKAQKNQTAYFSFMINNNWYKSNIMRFDVENFYAETPKSILQKMRLLN